MCVIDYLIVCGLVDPDRMAVAGGLYGGYMVVWIAGHTDRFRCIVNHAGVYDLLGQYASDVTQGRAKSLGGSSAGSHAETRSAAGSWSTSGRRRAPSGGIAPDRRAQMGAHERNEEHAPDVVDRGEHGGVGRHRPR